MSRYLKPEDVEKCGFAYGPMDVTRAFSDRTHHTVIINTQKHDVQISVSNAGRKLHIFVNGKRWEVAE